MAYRKGTPPKKPLRLMEPLVDLFSSSNKPPMDKVHADRLMAKYCSDGDLLRQLTREYRSGLRERDSRVRMKKRELRRQPKVKKGQKHHYIPQFYLRPWLGADDRLEEFGHVPPSNQIRSRRRGTDSTGFKYDLYTIPGVTEETKQNIERFFMGTVDKTAAAARDELLLGVIPQGELRHAWARFLMSMAMRTPEEIRRFKENYVWYWMEPVVKYQDRYEAIRKPSWPPTLEEYFVSQDPDMVQRQAMMLAADLMQQENVTKHLMGAEWWIFDSSRVQRPFMTSDHPFVMTNGLKRPDGHFAIPIGPRHLFVAFMQKDFGEWFRKMPTGKIVRSTNEAVIGQGRKYVYGLDGSNIAEVRRLMGKRDYMTLLPTMTKREGEEARALMREEHWDE